MNPTIGEHSAVARMAEYEKQKEEALDKSAFPVPAFVSRPKPLSSTSSGIQQAASDALFLYVRNQIVLKQGEESSTYRQEECARHRDIADHCSTLSNRIRRHRHGGAGCSQVCRLDH